MTGLHERLIVIQPRTRTPAGRCAGDRTQGDAQRRRQANASIRFHLDTNRKNNRLLLYSRGDSELTDTTVILCIITGWDHLVIITWEEWRKEGREHISVHISSEPFPPHGKGPAAARGCPAWSIERWPVARMRRVALCRSPEVSQAHHRSLQPNPLPPTATVLNIRKRTLLSFYCSLKETFSTLTVWESGPYTCQSWRHPPLAGLAVFFSVGCFSSVCSLGSITSTSHARLSYH